MRNLLQDVCHQRWIILLVIAAAALLTPHDAHAQSSGQTVNECSTPTDYDSGAIEAYSCLSGNSTGLDVYVESDALGGTSGTGAQAELYLGSTQVYNSGVEKNPLDNTYIDYTYSPVTLNQTYTLDSWAYACINVNPENECTPSWGGPYTLSSVSVDVTSDIPAATPTFSPAAGAYIPTQTVTISDSTTGSTIYYTTNGATPTTSSTHYTGAVTVSATETLEAIAAAPGGYANSVVATAVYTIDATVATPTFSPVAGTYTSAQTVTISDSTAGATIYYTTNGSAPMTSSTVYSSAITVSATETLKAVATAGGYLQSAAGSAIYTLQAATPTFSPAAGAYGPSQSVTISDATSGATIYYTTNGDAPTTSSSVYSSAITVSATETLKAIAAKTSYSNSAVGSAAYTINGAAATPTFSPAAGTYTSTQTVTISDTTPGATIYYTTNGTTPTTSSTEYASAITVTVTETLEAIATASGYSNSTADSAVYTIQVATPTFSPAAGTYTSTQTVTISDGTSGAAIYYTTNGTTPTTSSTHYTGAITVSTTETLESIATHSSDTSSAVGSAAYTINIANHADLQPRGRNLRNSPDGIYQRFNHRFDDLLHHQRVDTDD